MPRDPDDARASADTTRGTRHLADAEVAALAAARSGDPHAEDWLAHLDLCDGCHSRVVQAGRGGAAGSQPGAYGDDDARPRTFGERTADGIYELGEVLAQGGMGRLYRATDTVLGRQVALKVPRTVDPLLLWRFEREAAISAGLHHPSIAAIFAAGRFADGTPYYVMPIIDGEPLERVMAGAVTMPERLAILGHMIDVCDAIGYAHAARIVHRDLKPNNVLVGAHAQTHVLDWGLAKRLPDAATARTPRSPVRRRSWSSFADSAAPGGAADGSPTRHGDVIGTPGYMAPEQALGEVVDERADVYALGAKLAQLLTGRVPGVAQLAELAAAPAELQAIVARAMGRTRDERYAHAGEMAAELRHYQTGQLVAAYAYRPWDHVRRFLGRHRIAVGAMGIAVVAVVVVTALAFRNVDRARDRAEASERRAVASRVAAEELAEFMLTDLTDRADGIWLVAHCDLVDALGDAGHAETGVDAHVHRCRSGVGILASQRDFQPPQALPMCDDADILAFGLKDRPLLDVELQHRMHLARADFFIADPADALKLVAEHHAIEIGACLCIIFGVNAGENAGGQHGWRKAGTLLVGPVGHDNRMLRLDAEIVHRADNFESAEHTQDAVIFAAGRLGVEVRAHIDRQRILVFTGAGGEHVAHGVNAHGHAGCLAPALKQMAPLAIGVSQGLAVVAAGNAGADFRHLHQRVPKPCTVDLHVRGQ